MSGTSGWLFVGAPGVESASGAVFVFRRSALGRWEPAQRLDPPASMAAQPVWFGWAVAVDQISGGGVVGAPGGSAAGAVVPVYVGPQGAWLARATPAISAPDYGLDRSLHPAALSIPDRFGYSVAIRGRRLLVGAPGASDPSSGNASGAAYLFTSRVAGRFDEDLLRSKVIPAGAGQGDRSGAAVELALPGPRPGTNDVQGVVPSFTEDDGVQLLVAGSLGTAAVEAGSDALLELDASPRGMAPLQPLNTPGYDPAVGVNVTSAWSDFGFAVFEQDVPSLTPSTLEQRTLPVGWLRPALLSGADDGLGSSIAADATSGVVVMGAPLDDGTLAILGEAFGDGAFDGGSPPSLARNRRAAGAVYIAECAAAAVERASTTVASMLADGEPTAALRALATGSLVRTAAAAATSATPWLLASSDASSASNGAAAIAGFAAGSAIGTCRPGAFRSVPCTAARPSVCLPCSRGRCPESQYEASGCTRISDRRCVPCSGPCPAGSFISRACSGSKDRVCSACPPGGARCPSDASPGSADISVPDVEVPMLCDRFSDGGCAVRHPRLPAEPGSGRSSAEQAFLEAAVSAGGPGPWDEPDLAQLQPGRDLRRLLEYGRANGAASARAAGALAALAASTGGASWNAPWPTDGTGAVAGDPCTTPWSGVECDDRGRVVELRLSGRRLLGVFPAALCEALGETLRLLDVSHNLLTAMPPATLALCTRLEVLDLSFNKFGGGQGFGEVLLAMKRLEHLSVASSGLEAMVPPGLITALRRADSRA